MKKKQITAQNMYQSLLNVMGTFNSAWSSNPAISAVVTTLASLLGLLGLAGTNQANNTKGITQTKAQARSTLILMALAHSAAGMAPAGELAKAIRKIDSSFDPRNYGYNSFKNFLEALKPKYEIVVNDKGTMLVKKKE
ncbi:MAG TPA: OST-HTH/LOTUS domain-containing protein [Bacteroidia bacterium]